MKRKQMENQGGCYIKEGEELAKKDEGKKRVNRVKKDVVGFR